MEKFKPAFGRDYDAYPTAAQVRQKRLRGWYLQFAGFCMLVLLWCFHTTAMQPYAVTENGVCMLEVIPTDWDNGNEVPCGTVDVRFSVPHAVYYAD